MTNNQSYYLISQKKLRELLIANLQLGELEQGGVDNWEWYGEDRQDYIYELADEYGLDHLDDMDYADIVDAIIDKEYTKYEN